MSFRSSLDQICETKLTSGQSSYIAEFQLTTFEGRTAVKAAVTSFVERWQNYNILINLSVGEG